MPVHDDTFQPPRPPRSRRRDTATLGLWVLMSPDHRRIGTVLPLTARGIEVGRGEGVGDRFVDDWLSRQHFRVGLGRGSTVASGPWLLADCDTRNGTIVNGERRRHAALRLGDVVRAGATLCMFDRGAEPGDPDHGLIGVSEAAFALRQAIERAARGERPVHVLGESGSGKEVVAQALHRASGRRGEFLGLNMAAVVDSLAESQLFGHRRGAFSGASADHVGAFDAAADGTLLLDEIAELAPAVQAKLLRAVETGHVHRLGDARPHRVDVRLVTATHRDLRAMVDEGAFREDLYWRLAHTQLHVAPLRDRKLDVQPLFEHFLRRHGGVGLADVVRLQSQWAWHAADLLEVYLRYDWPGNVRELRDEATALSAAMASRSADAITGPIPPPDEVLSPRLLGTVARTDRLAPAVIDSGHHPILATGPDPQEVARLQALLQDPEALLAAIRLEADGKVKRFADQLATCTGRTPAAARRAIYRALGDRIGALRGGDGS